MHCDFLDDEKWEKKVLIKLWWHTIDCRTHLDLWGIKMWKSEPLQSEIQCLCARGRWKSFWGILTASSYVSLRKRSGCGGFSDTVVLAQCVLGLFSLGKPSLSLRMVSGLVQPWRSGVGCSVCMERRAGPRECWSHLTGFLNRAITTWNV